MILRTYFGFDRTQRFASLPSRKYGRSRVGHDCDGRRLANFSELVQEFVMGIKRKHLQSSKYHPLCPLGATTPLCSP